MQPFLKEDTIIEDAIIEEESQERPDFFTETKQLFESYISERTALLKLQVAEKISVTAAAVVSGILLLFLAIFLLIFVSITLGFLFSRLFDNNYAAGFGIVAGIYLLLILVVVFFGKSLFGNAVTKKMIQSFFKKK